MKLKHICILFVLLAAGIMVLGVQQSWDFLHKNQSGSEIILRMAVPYTDCHPSALTAAHFANLVHTQTDGQIRIQVYTESQLGNETDTIEQLKFGGIAFSIACTLSLKEDDVILKKMGGSDQTDPVTLVLPKKEHLVKNKLETLAIFHPDIRCIANNKYPLTVPVSQTSETRKQLVIQAHNSEPLMEYLSSLGLSAVQSTENDLAGSLNYGYIDGAELTITEYAASNLSDLLPYLSITEGLWAPDLILASQVSMGNLTAEYQNIIRSCAKEAAVYQKSILEEYQKTALETLQSLYLTPEGGTS